VNLLQKKTRQKYKKQKVLGTNALSAKLETHMAI